MSNVAVINTEARANLSAGGRPTAIVPQSIDEAYRLAKAVCMAQMAPKGMDTPEKCMIAIMRGLEIGLSPFVALDKIAIVNGRPVLWGDGVVGLVRGSGLCEWVKERIEGEGDNRVAVCESKRKGEPDPVRRTFSVKDAKQAGLWGKSGPWQQYPERMLSMRARAFCLRDGFADVLGGMYIKEELEGVQEQAPRAPTPPAPPPAPSIEHKPEPVKEFVQATQAAFPGAEVTDATADDVIDPEALMQEFKEASELARDEASLNEAYDDLIIPIMDKLSPPDKAACELVYRLAVRRLSK